MPKQFLENKFGNKIKYDPNAKNIGIMSMKNQNQVSQQ